MSFHDLAMCAVLCLVSASLASGHKVAQSKTRTTCIPRQTYNRSTMNGWYNGRDARASDCQWMCHNSTREWCAHAEFSSAECKLYDCCPENANVTVIPGVIGATCGPAPGVVGDPHLTNLRGEKFDIHDGMHRLVHYPKGAPESEALLVVDARAVDMGHSSDCYSVYLDSVKISGQWIGDVINVSADKTQSSSDAGIIASFAHKQMDWFALSTFHAKLPLHGTMPITITTSMRKASGADAMGGEEISFAVGMDRPVFVQVWSSHGKNALTNNEDVRYLNVEVKNLPRESGGIIGLDSYSRPTTSLCELVKEERDLVDFVNEQSADINLLQRHSKFRWEAFATVAEE